MSCDRQKRIEAPGSVAKGATCFSGLVFVDCFFGIGTRFLSHFGKTLPRRTNKCAYPVVNRRIERG